jgi:hypothetical protein
MIIFKQLPLGSLDTFEDELLFLLAGTVTRIVGMEKRSMLSGKEVTRCYFQVCDDPVDTVNLNSFAKIFKKYNKTLSGLFEIKLTKNYRGRWDINIKENLEELPEI